MILKGSQRGGAKQLALHLLNTEENEHVEVHGFRGFAADNLVEALMESYAISRGTKCIQHLFSLSLSPPPGETAKIEDFEDAVTRVETKMGLGNQPRAIVFHEKEGRRHAHAVWSRIDAEEMKAVHLPHFKVKLRDISRELFLDHEWQMPKGLINSKERDPANFSLTEWQQAKRAKQHPEAIKSIFRECWAASDSRSAFENALRERGFLLAQGDRRSFVAVDFMGEVYSIARKTSQKTKSIRERLGDPEDLPNVEDRKREIRLRMNHMLRNNLRDAEAKLARRSEHIEERRQKLVREQRDQREAHTLRHSEREAEERVERAKRIRGGLRGIWDWMTGKKTRINRQNEQEERATTQRCQSEMQDLIKRQLVERRKFQVFIERARQRSEDLVSELRADVMRFECAEQINRGQHQIGTRPKSNKIHENDEERSHDPG